MTISIWAAALITVIWFYIGTQVGWSRRGKRAQRRIELFTKAIHAELLKHDTSPDNARAFLFFCANVARGRAELEEDGGTVEGRLDP